MENNQTRLILWTVPRTLSTAFLKCMSGIPNSQMFYEPYTSAFLFGPERSHGGAIIPGGVEASSAMEEEPTKTCTEKIPCGNIHGFDDSLCSYKWVKEHLECCSQDKQLVFVKDMAYSLNKKYDFLPVGYKYIFLIRNPRKVMASWKKLISEFSEKNLDDFELDELPQPVMPLGLGYGELAELYDYVVGQGIDREPVIIDADDLVSDPDTILSSSFKILGVPYTPDLLTWEEGTAVIETWAVGKGLKTAIGSMESFNNVKLSSCFVKPYAKADRGDDTAALSSDILRCVDRCMPLYMKLYEKRIK